MKQFLLTIGLIAFLFGASAQTCPLLQDSKTGNVYLAGPSNFEFRASTQNMLISFARTGGAAAEKVKIFVNDVEVVEYDRRGYFDHELTNVRGKNIRCQVINYIPTGDVYETTEGVLTDPASKVSYKLEAFALTKHLTPGQKPAQGRILGKNKKVSVTLMSSCTNNTKVVVKRTSPTGTAKIKVYRKMGGTQQAVVDLASPRITDGQTTRQFYLEGNWPHEIELENFDGSKVSFTIEAHPAQQLKTK